MRMQGNNVLIKPVDLEERTAGGLYIPNTGKISNVGIVMAVGPDVKEIKCGEKAIFKAQMCTDVEWGGVGYLITDAKNIPLHEGI
jgi:co-chaperonin GroES (HSP10)